MRAHLPSRPFLGLALAAIVGCAGGPLDFGIGKKESSQQATQAVVVPSVAPVGATQETQKKGGVTISVSTVPFAAKQVEKREYKPKFTLLSNNSKKNYEKTTTPFWCSWPSKLRFTIRIVNNTSDVVRLSGVLVRLNVDGKDYALDGESSGLRSLINGVIAPQEQKEFNLAAAPTPTLRDGENISLRIYGVPTGSTREKDKGNFEWNYRVKTKQETRDVQVKTTTVALREDEVQWLENVERSYPPETRDEKPVPTGQEHGALWDMMQMEQMQQTPPPK